MKFTTLLIFLFLSISGFSQKSEYLEGEIISRKGDTIKAKIKVLNRFASFNRVRYLDSTGKEKKISKENIKSYSKGNEFYETLILNSKIFVLAKRIIHGPNMTLYYRDESTELFPGVLETGIPQVLEDEFRAIYLKDKNNRVFKVSELQRTGQTPLKKTIDKIQTKRPSKNKKLKKFLFQYPNVISKIENNELSTIEEIVVECNNVNGIYWKKK